MQGNLCLWSIHDIFPWKYHTRQCFQFALMIQKLLLQVLPANGTGLRMTSAKLIEAGADVNIFRTNPSHAQLGWIHWIKESLVRFLSKKEEIRCDSELIRPSATKIPVSLNINWKTFLWSNVCVIVIMEDPPTTTWPPYWLTPAADYPPGWLPPPPRYTTPLALHSHMITWWMVGALGLYADEAYLFLRRPMCVYSLYLKAVFVLQRGCAPDHFISFLSLIAKSIAVVRQPKSANKILAGLCSCKVSISWSWCQWFQPFCPVDARVFMLPTKWLSTWTFQPVPLTRCAIVCEERAFDFFSVSHKNFKCSVWWCTKKHFTASKLKALKQNIYKIWQQHNSTTVLLFFDSSKDSFFDRNWEMLNWFFIFIALFYYPSNAKTTRTLFDHCVRKTGLHGKILEKGG